MQRWSDVPKLEWLLHGLFFASTWRLDVAHSEKSSATAPRMDSPSAAESEELLSLPRFNQHQGRREKEKEAD